MQTRTCFNGGEQSPELAARCDLDAYMRGCRVLENWVVSQMGGVKRRRGMRYFADALSEHSRLVPYVYSYADADGLRFLVEIAGDVVRVLDMEGAEAARFTDGEDGMDFYLDPDTVRWRQLNALLYLTTQDNRPMVLKRDGDGVWTLEAWEFKHHPWRYVNEKRDHPLVLTCKPVLGDVRYTVEFDPKEEPRESAIESADLLRASFWLEQQEAFAKGGDLRRNVIITDGLRTASKGDRLAVHTDTTVKYYICKQTLSADVYTEGLDEPACYPDCFVEAENLDGFEGVTPVYSVKDVTGNGFVDKGTKVAIKSGYWEYFTCIRDFTEEDMVDLGTGFGDYPGYFVRGLAVGNALTCRGKWEFYCSGLWYGSYEVRKCYDSGDLGSDWETAGTSFSRIGEASNTQLTGDESDEECFLRLFLTRSKFMGASLASGFPADSCGNRLIVPGYRHDMVLRAVPTLDDAGEVAAVEWSCEDKVPVEWVGRRTVHNWSWAAFSERYGFPLLCEVYNQRLVFASTLEQPQTVWMSRTDDFNNFSTGDSDDAALALTMATSSQNPVCWMMAQSHRLLPGTSEAEWVISAGSSQGSITNSNAQIEDHGHVGSAAIPALMATDKVLYIERGSGRCYEYGYSFETDGYRSKDLTVLAPHILRDHGGVKHGTMLRKPDTVAVFVLADGQLALCTYNTMHEVNAWHRWITNGHILAACAMPDGNRSDRLFLVVKRETYTAAGDLADSSLYIEVVDDDSPYDDVGNDYVSTLLTNALINPLEARVERTPKFPVAVLFGQDCLTEPLRVTGDGEQWVPVASNAPVMTKGWHEVITVNRWQYEHVVGLRFSGPAGCEFLAMQG